MKTIANDSTGGAADVYCLSIRQPWAWLVAHGWKNIENRTWQTNYRGRLLIHAAGGMTSEGVGSFWPFVTGRAVNHANQLLEQIMDTLSTRHKLIPNQHIGAYRVGFMPQWLAREYLARRGTARFRMEQLDAARCPLLGYVPKNLTMQGYRVPTVLLQVDHQPEVGVEGYEAGAAMLTSFFKRELAQYDTPELSSLGRRIIQVCMDDGDIEDYTSFAELL